MNLRSLPSSEPGTSTGRVQWMWPEIWAALATGRTVKEIWEAAQRDGVEIAYPQFRVYVSRLRRRLKDRSVDRPTAECHAGVLRPTEVSTTPAPRPSVDPLYNIRVQLERKRQSNFEYNPFPDPEDDVT